MYLPISLLFFLLVGCAGSGVTVTKSKTLTYFSEVFSKSKDVWKSSEPSSAENAPPPSPFQPSERQVIQARSQSSGSDGMSPQDYAKAIDRLESSIAELEKKHGKDHVEVGETYLTLGSMHEVQGNSKQAKQAYERAQKILSSWLGSEHPRVWKLRNTIAKLK